MNCCTAHLENTIEGAQWGSNQVTLINGELRDPIKRAENAAGDMTSHRNEEKLPQSIAKGPPSRAADPPTSGGNINIAETIHHFLITPNHHLPTNMLVRRGFLPPEMDDK